MKILVTHVSPDLDAVAGCWLIKTFLPGWETAQLRFVPAGSTYENSLPDENPDIIHIDTGLGMFDHHQKPNRTSATKLVFEHLLKNEHIEKKVASPLERLVHMVNELDHFGEVYFPDPADDRYDLCLHQLVEGLKYVERDDAKVCANSHVLLTAAFQIFRKKVAAEEEIKKGYVFLSKWGRSLIMGTENEESMKLALKMGFSFVARKDPRRGNIRIKTLPQKKLDLTPLYKKLASEDKKASWFLHISTNMLLNGSSKNPTLIPSVISLKRLIEIIREI